MGKRLLLVFCAILTFSATALSLRLPPPHLYGRVVINNYWMKKDRLPPVVFDHWLHRAWFTCRLCHVDIGFAMEAGATGIDAATNKEGYYCGVCHDGKRTYDGKTIFEACADDIPSGKRKRCYRCHSRGQDVENAYDFDSFTEDLPRYPSGQIDWVEAEEKGHIHPVDFLEGISMKRDPMRLQKDFSVISKATWMSDVVFSHEKHAAWNGCELCHPEIFPSTEKGTVKYTMLQIADGQYCGACHTLVAFTYLLCDKCHTG